MKKLLTIKSTKSSFDLLPKIPMRMRITSIQHWHGTRILPAELM